MIKSEYIKKLRVGCSLGLELVGLDFGGHFDGAVCDQEAVELESSAV